MMKKLLNIFFIVTSTLSVSAQWNTFNVATESSFRGISVVDRNTIWASGTDGTFVRTINGGKTWKVGRVPGAENLDFRDIEAFGADIAYLLSIGEGSSSRIYKTIDGGENWTLQFTNKNSLAFFDAFAFWDRDHGIAMSDPVDGHFYLAETDDGGLTWRVLSQSSSPSAMKGEAAFAASGTCIVARGSKTLWMVTGGSIARVHKSTDGGRTWTPYQVPIGAGNSSAGIFSLSMADDLHGIAVGGEYTKPFLSTDTGAVTADGGKTWKKVTGLGGYRSGAAYITRSIVVAVGTNGSDISYNGGTEWRKLDAADYNAVASAGRDATWAVGPKGRIAKLRIP